MLVSFSASFVCGPQVARLQARPVCAGSVRGSLSVFAHGAGLPVCPGCLLGMWLSQSSSSAPALPSGWASRWSGAVYLPRHGVTLGSLVCPSVVCGSCPVCHCLWFCLAWVCGSPSCWRCPMLGHPAGRGRCLLWQRCGSLSMFEVVRVCLSWPGCMSVRQRGYVASLISSIRSRLCPFWLGIPLVGGSVFFH